MANPSLGHRAGAEVAYLMRVIEDVVVTLLSRRESGGRYTSRGC
jgi:hypothetical protein